jgi:regulator of sigma E protease
MALLETLFFTFIAFGVLVTIHEFGHFWVARRCGVKVEKFSIGFGKTLFSWRDKQNTEFVLALLPLGGYVKMLDERVEEVSEQDRPHAFNAKTVWQRMAIISAGPIANFLLAILAFWLLFLGGEKGLAPVIGDVQANSIASSSGLQVGMEITAVNQVPTTTWNSVNRQLFDYIGVTGNIPLTVIGPSSEDSMQLSIPVIAWLREADNPSPLRELGVMPVFEFESLVVGAVIESGSGYQAGLKENDILIAINGQMITSADQFIDTVATNANQPLVIELERPIENQSQGQLISLEVTPASVIKKGQTVGQLGIQLGVKGQYPEYLRREVNYGVFGALVRGAQETYSTSGFILSSLAKLVMGEISPKNLSGPVTIAKMAGDTARAGVDNFIRFIAILSIMLGVMNLLPIPVLDGGHLVYCLVEWVKGSPVSDHVQMIGYKIGFFLLVGLMLFATFNDLTRPF